jgi:hypothetical protein
MQLLPGDEMERLDSMLQDYPLAVILRGLQEIASENVAQCGDEIRAEDWRTATRALRNVAEYLDAFKI